MGALLTSGGTVLGTSNRGRFAAKTGHGEQHVIPREILDEAKRNFDALGLRALICVGGDGSLTIAQQLFEHGVPVVGVPKTIDNDLEATADEPSALIRRWLAPRTRWTGCTRRRRATTRDGPRGDGALRRWIAATPASRAAGDIILIPEIPFAYESICRKIAEREAMGRLFTLVVVAEGARGKGSTFVTQGSAEADREARLGVWRGRCGRTRPAHGQGNASCRPRPLAAGGGPTTFDRLLCTRFGRAAPSNSCRKENSAIWSRCIRRTRSP